jgi:hypothetical protein
MEAMKPLLAKGEKELVQELLEEQHKLVRAYPDEEELRTPYSGSLGLLVCSEGVLDFREQQFKRLKAFCEEFPNDWTLDIALAQAARLLCEEYVLADRLPDAESMNQIIRGLAHPRSLPSVIPTMRHIEPELAETDLWLIDPFMRAQR